MEIGVEYIFGGRMKGIAQGIRAKVSVTAKCHKCGEETGFNSKESEIAILRGAKPVCHVCGTAIEKTYVEGSAPFIVRVLAEEKVKKSS